MWSAFANWLDRCLLAWHNTASYGGVGAPVGLTVFKTAGGSLGAVPGGFDSHTPLPAPQSYPCVSVILPIGFGDFQNLCFLFLPPKLCFPFSYRKNAFYYCATFIGIYVFDLHVRPPGIVEFT